MKQVYFLLAQLFILTSCSSQGNKDTIQLMAPNSEDACEICLLEDQFYNCDVAKAYGYATRKPDSYFDSIEVRKNFLEKELELKLNQFKKELNLTSDFIARDSARNWCVNSYEFGSHLSNNRRDSIYTVLYNEMYMGAGKNGFTISARKVIEERNPRHNSSGEIYITKRDSNNVKYDIIIDDWDEWKINELRAWDEWMAEIDTLIIELCLKSYSELTELEKLVLEYKIKWFIAEQ